VTIDDVERLGDDQRYDLIRGRLMAAPPAERRQGRMVAHIGHRLYAFALEFGGEAFAAETGFILARHPDTLLGPDAACIRPERITPDVPEDGYLPIAPDLAVEVLSPSNTRAEMAEKIDAYLEGGTQLVWIVDPVRKTVTVYTPGRAVQALGVRDRLDGADVLPGLSVAVADIFR
jgi:Uma2 family endonuclease